MEDSEALGQVVRPWSRSPGKPRSNNTHSRCVVPYCGPILLALHWGPFTFARARQLPVIASRRNFEISLKNVDENLRSDRGTEAATNKRKLAFPARTFAELGKPSE
jgi:hypothetical protein